MDEKDYSKMNLKELGEEIQNLASELAKENPSSDLFRFYKIEIIDPFKKILKRFEEIKDLLKDIYPKEVKVFEGYIDDMQDIINSIKNVLNDFTLVEILNNEKTMVKILLKYQERLNAEYSKISEDEKKMRDEYIVYIVENDTYEKLIDFEELTNISSKQKIEKEDVFEFIDYIIRQDSNFKKEMHKYLSCCGKKYEKFLTIIELITLATEDVRNRIYEQYFANDSSFLKTIEMVSNAVKQELMCSKLYDLNPNSENRGIWGRSRLNSQYVIFDVNKNNGEIEYFNSDELVNFCKKYCENLKKFGFANLDEYLKMFNGRYYSKPNVKRFESLKLRNQLLFFIEFHTDLKNQIDANDLADLMKNVSGNLKDGEQAFYSKEIVDKKVKEYNEKKAELDKRKNNIESKLTRIGSVNPWMNHYGSGLSDVDKAKEIIQSFFEIVPLKKTGGYKSVRELTTGFTYGKGDRYVYSTPITSEKYEQLKELVELNITIESINKEIEARNSSKITFENSDYGKEYARLRSQGVDVIATLKD